MVTPREQRVAEAFLELADTGGDGFVLAEFVHTLARRCAELVDAAAAGVALTDQGGGLRLLTATDARARALLERELLRHAGPSAECVAVRQAVHSDDLARDRHRWPGFATEALAAGFGAVHAFPLQARRTAMGVLSLFSTAPQPLCEADARLVTCLADAASLGLSNDEALRESRARVLQLQQALDSRVILEQAKGVIAARTGLDMDQAFEALRRYARSGNHRLSEIASAVVDRKVEAANIVRAARERRRHAR